jgi:hypothetical protein
MPYFRGREKKKGRCPNRRSGEDFGEDLLVPLHRLPGPRPEPGAEVAQGPARREDLPGYHTHPLLLQAELIDTAHVSATATDTCRKPCTNIS